MVPKKGYITDIHCEHGVIQSVIDTTSRRLLDGRLPDIFLEGIHTIVVGRDIDESFEESASVTDRFGIAVVGKGNQAENADRWVAVA